MKITFEQIMDLNPCLPEDEIKSIVGDGLEVCTDTICDLRRRCVRDEHIIWVASRVLEAPLILEWMTKVKIRLLRHHVLNCGLPSAEAWAKEWLDGKQSELGAQLIYDTWRLGMFKTCWAIALAFETSLARLVWQVEPIYEEEIAHLVMDLMTLLERRANNV